MHDSTELASKGMTRRQDKPALTEPEQRVLRAFRMYLITPGQMLCFYGPELEKHKAALRQLTEKKLLVKEEFKGGYSLTRAGFSAMRGCK